MRVSERQQQILDILITRESATVADLSESLRVSTVTIRADLAGLADDGRMSAPTAARCAMANLKKLSFVTRVRHQPAQKSAIGQKAASLIAPVESILLDASSTAVATAQGIKAYSQFRELTVVTTGIWTALELMGVSNIHVLLTGGLARWTDRIAHRTDCAEGAARSQLFQGLPRRRGLTPEGGLTDVHLTEVEIKRCIVERAADNHRHRRRQQVWPSGIGSIRPYQQDRHPDHR